MMTFLSGEYAVHLYILICIYVILAQSLNLVFGVGQLFNLAHIAVYAVGAYTTAILATDYYWDFSSCLIASALVSGLFALLIGAISLRLESDYFAIGTIAFSSVVSALLVNWRSLTRGVLGIPGIPRPEFAGIDFYNNYNFLGLALSLAVLCHVFLWFVFRSSYSRSLRAQAEYAQAASALGRDVALVRNAAFFLASCFAGMAGSLFAYYLNYIDPSSFAFSEMVFVLTIIILARPGSFWGVIGASAFLVLLPEPLRFSGEVQGGVEWAFGLATGQSLQLPLVRFVIEFCNFVSSPSVLGPMRQLLYALILFTVVYVRREQLFPQRRMI